MEGQGRKCAAFASVLFVTVALAGSAGAVSPGVNGRVFYASTGSGSYNIWSVNPDGSVPTQLTTQTSNAVGAQRPSVSGDGSKVAFMEFDDNPPNVNRIQIWIMNGSGSGETQLTHSGDNFLNTEPGISPDGSKIAFQGADVSGSGTTGQDIWIMNADGGGETQLTSSADDEKSPEFSPDGTKIVYVRATGTNQIWLMNANGSNQHVLLDNPGVQDTGPSWSPDGTKIVYADSANGLSFIHADGSNPTQLLDGGGHAIVGQDPTWSPDGTKIAFYAVPNGGGSEGIFTIPATGGSDPQLLLNLPSDFQSVYPSWAAAKVAPPADGLGTMTASPTSVHHHAGHRTIHFAYKAGAGGIKNGAVTLTVPGGWSAPSLAHSARGYVTVSSGVRSVVGRTIVVTGLSLQAGGRLTIVYGSRAVGGPGATAPQVRGLQNWPAKERGSSTGKLKFLAASPSIRVR